MEPTADLEGVWDLRGIVQNTHQVNLFLKTKAETNSEPFHLQAVLKIRRWTLDFNYYECMKRWAGHVARMGEERGCIGSWWGNRREGDHWGDLGIDGWIIL